MKLRTLALAAIIPLIAIVAPSHARIEENTGDLLELIEANGIRVTFNDDNCNLGPDVRVLGVYHHSGLRRSMTLCPGDTVDPIDHATVRHEVWHAIQHCVNVARGTSLDSPVNLDTTELTEYVNDSVPQYDITNIRQNYPTSQWFLEYEATMAEYVLTADDLMQLFNKACVM